MTILHVGALFVTSGGLEKSDELGEVTNYANRWKLHHRSSYTHTVLLFAVKYKFMMLWLDTTINSSALSGLLHLIKHILNL